MGVMGVQNAGSLQAHELDDAQIRATIDQLYVMVMSIFVFLVQGGFALLEAGAVRKKNVINIIIKNIADAAVGGVFYWAVGFGFSYGTKGGGNAFIGNDYFFLNNWDDFGVFFFNLTFAATTATIVSGAVAERARFESYLIYSTALTAFVYPVVAHWVWSEAGFLNRWQFIDFAGGGAVHSLGGWTAFLAAFVLGPRYGRFDTSGRPVNIPGHNIMTLATGFFILWAGFFAFNAGSTISLQGGLDQIASRAMVNTALSGGCAGTLILIWVKFRTGKWCVLAGINSLLGGMVATCSGVGLYEPWAACVIGCIGGVMQYGTSWLILAMKVDDPLDAASVHGGCGFVAVMSAAFFTPKDTMKVVYGSGWKAYGVFYGANASVIYRQFLGWATIVLWVIVTMGPLFLILKLLGYFRVPLEQELIGLDVTKHGLYAFPEDVSVQKESAWDLGGDRNNLADHVRFDRVNNWFSCWTKKETVSSTFKRSRPASMKAGPMGESLVDHNTPYTQMEDL